MSRGEPPKLLAADSPRGPVLGWLKTNELALLAALVLVVIATALLDKNHAYWTDPLYQLELNGRRVAQLGIVALGATVVIIAGGIDLSAGSVIALSSTVCGLLMLKLAPQQFANDESVGAPVLTVVVLSTVVIGLLIGTLHTWLITTLRLPPFVVTLGSLVGLRSLARALCLATISSEDKSFTQPFFMMLKDEVWISVAVMLALACGTWFVLQKTVLGRHVYALGGNEQAARLSGIRTENVKWFAYCFSAVTASVAGLFFLPESGIKPISIATGFELNAIAAAVVGGCSLQGGVGTIQGTLLGAMFLRAVVDAVAKIIKAAADVYEGMIVGAIVVLAVTFSQLREFRQSGRQLFPGALGACAIPTLALLVWVVSAIALGKGTGLGVGAVTLLFLILVSASETLRARRK